MTFVYEVWEKFPCVIVKDQIFPHMAVKDKIICLPFSAFYGNISPMHMCTSSDSKVSCVCMATPSSSAEA